MPDQTRSGLWALRCPIDELEFLAKGQQLVCLSGHSFDVARQGYVNLAGSDPRTKRLRADTAAMVQARQRFLASGFYQPLARAVTEAASAALGEATSRPADQRGNVHGDQATDMGTHPPVIAELGAGPGYYLAQVLQHYPAAVGIATDLSTAAAARAARAHPRIVSVVANTWSRLPIASGTVAAVTVVFAPRSLPEILRILRPGGELVVLRARPGHLAELRDEFDLLGVGTDGGQSHQTPAGDDDSGAGDRSPANEGAETGASHLTSAPLTTGLALVETTDIDFTMTLGPADVHDLIAMGPNAWHTDFEQVSEHLRLHPVDREVSVSVAVQRLRKDR